MPPAAPPSRSQPTRNTNCRQCPSRSPRSAPDRSSARSHAVGTLNGYEEVDLAPKVDGRVLAVRADVGDTVVARPGRCSNSTRRTHNWPSPRCEQGLNAELAKLGLTALPTGDFDVEAVPAVPPGHGRR